MYYFLYLVLSILMYKRIHSLPRGRGQPLWKPWFLLQLSKHPGKFWSAWQDGEVLGRAAWGGYSHGCQQYGKSLGEEESFPAGMCCGSSQASKNKTDRIRIKDLWDMK